MRRGGEEKSGLGRGLGSESWALLCRTLHYGWTNALSRCQLANMILHFKNTNDTDAHATPDCASTTFSSIPANQTSGRCRRRDYEVCGEDCAKDHVSIWLVLSNSFLSVI